MLPPQLPFIAEEKLQEVWPLGDAAFAIFICPITHDVMTDPVVSADGYTYERAAIARWFETSRKSPVTGQMLPHADLVPNQSVRTLLKTLIDMTEKQQASETLSTTLQRKHRSAGISSGISSRSDSSDSTHWEDPKMEAKRLPKTKPTQPATGPAGSAGSAGTESQRTASAGSASASSSSSSSSSSSGCQVSG